MASQVGKHAVILPVRLHAICPDGEGLKVATGWKGASGLKPCLFCWNVLQKNHALLDVTDAGMSGFVDITHANMSNFKKSNASEWRKANDEMQTHAEDATMTKTAKEEYSKFCGFNYTPQGLLKDEPLRSLDWPRIWRYDWMHTYLQNGVVNVEANAMVGILQENQVLTRDALRQFIGSFTFTYDKRSKLRNLAEVFDRTNSETGCGIKAAASEMLG